MLFLFTQPLAAQHQKHSAAKDIEWKSQKTNDGYETSFFFTVERTRDAHKLQQFFVDAAGVENVTALGTDNTFLLKTTKAIPFLQIVRYLKQCGIAVTEDSVGIRSINRVSAHKQMGNTITKK